MKKGDGTFDYIGWGAGLEEPRELRTVDWQLYKLAMSFKAIGITIVMLLAAILFILAVTATAIL